MIFCLCVIVLRGVPFKKWRRCDCNIKPVKQWSYPPLSLVPVSEASVVLEAGPAVGAPCRTHFLSAPPFVSADESYSSHNSWIRSPASPRDSQCCNEGTEQHVTENRNKTWLVQLVMTQHQTPSDDGNPPICCYGDATSVFTNTKLTLRYK